MADRYDTTLPIAERKRHGIFYTPEPVVRYLLRATAPVGPVADLSCGDGAFLVEAAAMGCQVMGVDRDRQALAAAAQHLSIFPSDQWRLKSGDGLAAKLPWVPDVVIGNPPYLEAKKATRAIKKRCRSLFPEIARGGSDVFVFFLQAGLKLLCPGGRLGYIIPNKFLIAEYARPLREHILRDMTIEQIIDVSDLPTFRDAAVYPVMLVVRKTPPAAWHGVMTGHVTALDQLETGDFPRTVIPQSHWHNTSRQVFWLPPTELVARDLVDRLVSDPRTVPLSQVLEIRWSVSFHRAGLRDEFVFPEPTGVHPHRLLGGMRFHGNADVRRYRTAWSGWWIDYDERRARECRNQLPPLSRYLQPKLLIAQNARRITATLDTEGYICKDTFLLGLQRGDVSLEYLLGLLNSTLLSYLYGVLFKATHVAGAYLHYLACYLDDLPIRLADDPQPICCLVRRLLDPHCGDDERQALDRQLDTLVYDLYGLSAAERALVDAAIPYAWGEQATRRGAWDARKCAKREQE